MEYHSPWEIRKYLRAKWSVLLVVNVTMLNVHTAKRVFLGFGISITSKNVFKPKKLNSDAFCHKIKLYKFPAFATPIEVDRVMKDW